MTHRGPFQPLTFYDPEGLGQAGEMGQQELHEVQQRFRFCLWGGITPCTGTGRGLSGWRTACQKMS